MAESLTSALEGTSPPPAQDSQAIVSPPGSWRRRGEGVEKGGKGGGGEEEEWGEEGERGEEGEGWRRRGRGEGGEMGWDVH